MVAQGSGLRARTGIRMSPSTPGQHSAPDPPHKPEAMVPCISCRALISREAKLCPTCRSYQVNWKNDLAYFGSTAGFIAILASAVTFISGQLAEGWRVATWKDIIQPVYFEYPGDVAFINSGDGDAVVASVDVTWGESPRNTVNIPINKPVPKDGFVVVTLKSPFEDPLNIDNAHWAKNTTGVPSPKLFAESMRYGDRRRCAEHHFYNAGHLVFRRIDGLEPDKRLVSAPVIANLNIVSLHSGAVVTTPLQDMRVTFLFIPGNRPECTDEAFELRG